MHRTVRLRTVTITPASARTTLALAAAAALTVTAAACSSSKPSTTPATGASTPGVSLPNLSGQNLQVAAVWTGAEQQNFLKVINQFDKLTGAHTTFVPTGDNVSTFLGTKIQGGAPPDVAFLPQPGVLQQFAKAGWLKPIGSATQQELASDFSSTWQGLGSYNGTPYGVYFKAAYKSLIWYNNAVWQQAGLTATPTTWSQFLKDAQTISDSGTTPVSIGGADGWTLCDWFENIYLSQAGPTLYDKLAKHQIPWTDPSVTKALTTLAQLFGKPSLIAGGSSGALQTDYPTSVDQTFAGTPKAGMVFEADFVETNILQDTKAKIGTDAKEFAFPTVDGGQSPAVTGGDVAVALKSGTGAQALLQYLASPAAAEIEVGQGGFLSPNKAVPPSAYPDDTERSIAQQLIAAGSNFRYGMSDLAPGAFGGTKGQGEWKDLQDFLAKPTDIVGAQKQLEADAAKAYANAG